MSKPEKFFGKEAVQQEAIRGVLFEKCTKRLEEGALELQDRRYGRRETLRIQDGKEVRRPNPDYLPFHNSWHVQEAIGAVDNILRSMQKGGAPITEKDIRLGRIIAAFHDIVQNWREERQDGWMIKRQRFIGDNEQASADEFVAYMRKMNEEEGVEVFSARDMEVGQAAIMATVSGSGLKHNTVVQPNLTEWLEPLVRAMALADLATAGMGGGARYIDGGNRLFREENLDVVGADINELTDEQKELLMRRMLAWKRFQPKFAAGRRDLFESEIAPLPEGAKEELRKLFCKFDESIIAAQKDADELAKAVEGQSSVSEKFIKALELMGYKVDERSNGKKIIYP